MLKLFITTGILTLVLILGISINPVLAQTEITEFQDTQKQELYLKLIKELRCLVCQNQNLADSNADLAKDLRKKTYEQVNQGKEYNEIIDYMVNRYGDFVRYRPPFKMKTALLWVGPFIFLFLIILLAIQRTRKMQQQAPGFSNEELEKARNLIDRSQP